MTTQTQTQVAATLGITGRQLWALSSNPQFPAPASGADQSVTWNSADITAFATTWNSMNSNGWKVSTAAMPSFNFAYAAAHAPGQYYAPAFEAIRCSIFDSSGTSASVLADGSRSDCLGGWVARPPIGGRPVAGQGHLELRIDPSRDRSRRASWMMGLKAQPVAHDDRLLDIDWRLSRRPLVSLFP